MITTAETAAPVASEDGERPARPQRPGRLSRVPQALVMSGTAAIVLSLMAAFFVVYSVGFSALQEHRDQHQLYSSFRGTIDPASPVAPAIGGFIRPGTPIAVVDAPSIGVEKLVVVEGTSPSDLMAGPGHLRDTPLPGQPGQAILIGRSVLAGAPFRDITGLHAGAVITVTTGQGVFTYRVIGVRSGGAARPAIPSNGSLLTLITAHGGGSLASVAPSQVVYVDAVLDGSPAAVPNGPDGSVLQRPVAVPADELPGNGDPGAWPFIVLWLQALLVVVLAAVWCWKRWGRWQTWLVAASLVVAAMWALSQESVRLLPNVL